MTRTNIYDYFDFQADRAFVGWFDPDRAEAFYGSDPHETLYRTPSDRWVLRHKSGYGDTPATYEYLTGDAAKEWLLKTESNDDAVRRFFGEIEDESGPNLGGRPEVGPAFSVKFPPDLLAKVDEAARADGVSRAEWLRRAAHHQLARAGAVQ